MKLKHVLMLLLIAIIAIVPIKIIPILIDGYDLYESAIAESSIEDRIEQVRSSPSYISIDSISSTFLDQVIESEDQRFYKHRGFNLFTMTRAFFRNLMEGDYVEGGSTITQQLAKNLYFSFDKEYARKVAELIVALQLEKELEKEEILELYSNIAYFGNGCYGIESASNYYYGIHAADLSAEQSKILVRTLKSPSLYNPSKIQALVPQPYSHKKSLESRDFFR